MDSCDDRKQNLQEGQKAEPRRSQHENDELACDSPDLMNPDISPLEDDDATMVDI